MTFMNNDLQASHQILMMLEAAKSAQDQSIDSFPGIFAFIDRGCRVFKSNRRLAELMGGTNEDVIGKTMKPLFSIDTWGLFKQHVEESFRTLEQVHEFELNVDSDSKLSHSYYWNILSLNDSFTVGKVNLLIGNDITQLRTTERRMTEFFRSVPVGLLTISGDTVIEEQYSLHCERLLGRPSLGGKLFKDVVFSDLEKPLTTSEQDTVNTLGKWIGKKESLFKVFVDFLPKEIHLKNSKIVSITYQPLVYDGVVHKILVLLSEQKKFEAPKNDLEIKELREQQIAAQIRALKETSPRILESAMRDLGEGFHALNTAIRDQESPKVWSALHGIKGNARVAGFKYISEVAHSCESDFKSKLNQPDFNWAWVKNLVGALGKEHEELRAFYSALHKGRAHEKVELIGFERLREDLGDILKSGVLGGSLAATNKVDKMIQDLNQSEKVDLSDYEEKIRSIAKGTSGDLGKHVRVTFDAGGVKVDQARASALSDAFLHLVTNSVYHGIETTEVRKKKGKEEIGLIKINLSETEDSVICEVEDDGSGFDPDKIRNTARSKGIISEQKAANLTKEQLLEMIFEPGFSTVSEVSNIAGRGVGLDSVRLSMKKFKGSVRAESAESGGARFILTISREDIPVLVEHLYSVSDVKDNLVEVLEELIEFEKVPWEIDYEKLDEISWSGIVKVNLSELILSLAQLMRVGAGKVPSVVSLSQDVNVLKVFLVSKNHESFESGDGLQNARRMLSRLGIAIFTGADRLGVDIPFKLDSKGPLAVSLKIRNGAAAASLSSILTENIETLKRELSIQIQVLPSDQSTGVEIHPAIQYPNLKRKILKYIESVNLP